MAALLQSTQPCLSILLKCYLCWSSGKAHVIVMTWYYNKLFQKIFVTFSCCTISSQQSPLLVPNHVDSDLRQSGLSLHHCVFLKLRTQCAGTSLKWLIFSRSRTLRSVVQSDLHRLSFQLSGIISRHLKFYMNTQKRESLNHLMKLHTKRNIIRSFSFYLYKSSFPRPGLPATWAVKWMFKNTTLLALLAISISVN